MCLRLICNLFSSSPPPRYQFVTKSYRAVYFAVLLSSITLGREGGRGSVLSVLLSKRKGKPNLPSPFFFESWMLFTFRTGIEYPSLYSALSWSMGEFHYASIVVPQKPQMIRNGSSATCPERKRRWLLGLTHFTLASL